MSNYFSNFAAHFFCIRKTCEAVRAGENLFKMSYLIIKIISIIVTLVILLAVLATRREKEDKEKALHDAPDDAFQAWLKQASIYDMQKMLITTLVKIEPQYYKTDTNVTAKDFQSRMKILYETLPKDLRTTIYPDETVLLDYIQGSIDENPNLSLAHQKRDDLYKYFQENLSKGKLYENELFLKVMFLTSTENDKLEDTDAMEDIANGSEKKIDYKAIHDEMYYVEYKLIPHFIELFNTQPKKATQIIVSIYENLVTLQNNLRKVNPFAFGKVSGEVMGNPDKECLVVFEFPKPFDLPLAKYGAVYINHETQNYQYLTLEFSLNGKYVLGSKTQERHFNYGERDDLSKEEFIHEVCQHVGTDESILLPRNMISRKNMKEMNDRIFYDAVADVSHLVVCFYDFNKPSQTFIPVLDQLSQEYSNKLMVGLYDVYGGSENSSAVSEYNITALPTLLFFKGGKLVNRHIGICRAEDLRVLFNELLKS